MCLLKFLDEMLTRGWQVVLVPGLTNPQGSSCHGAHTIPSQSPASVTYHLKLQGFSFSTLGPCEAISAPRELCKVVSLLGAST